jgi:UDP-N-acetylglucosamine:LPS N-acetylglucosamine transferase
MVKAGAAEMILDNDLKRDLMNFILRLMDNDQITARLKEKVKSFADPDAAYKLAELLDYMSKYSVN